MTRYLGLEQRSRNTHGAVPTRLGFAVPPVTVHSFAVARLAVGFFPDLMSPGQRNRLRRVAIVRSVERKVWS
jgi:hypothetical protein